MIEPLAEREFDRRRQRFIGVLGTIGDLVVEQREEDGIRSLRFFVEAPGHDVTTQAAFEYEERYASGRAGWRLVKYVYEYREQPPPGRLAYHWHDEELHMHCVDRRFPSREHHYRGYVVTIFEAHDEFYKIYASDQTVSCAGLRPASAASQFTDAHR